MKAYLRLCAAVVTLFLGLALAMNLYILKQADGAGGIYRVEAKRLADENDVIAVDARILIEKGGNF